MKASPTTTAIARAAGSHALAGVRTRRALVAATAVAAGVGILAAAPGCRCPSIPCR